VNQYSVIVALVVERFNRTLKNGMWKLFTLNRNNKWIDSLEHFVHRKKYSVQVNALNIQFMIYKNFVGVKKHFFYFFKARYVQLAKLLHFIFGSSYAC